MIADTTFLSDLIRERRQQIVGPAGRFLASHREPFRTSIISAGEIMHLFTTNAKAWDWLSDWKIYQLNRGIVSEAADVDREQIASGGRLGENDNWIAGFARYYREPVISRDVAFDRVEGLRRVSY